MLNKLKLNIGAKISLSILAIVILLGAMVSFIFFRTFSLLTSDEFRKGAMGVLQEEKNIKVTFIVLLIVILMAAAALGVMLSKGITSKLNSIKEYLRLMEKGILPNDIEKQSNDELGEMTVIINNVVHSLKETSQFAHGIGEGNLYGSFTPLSENDVLGNSLLNMQQSLVLADKKEKQRNWVVNGIAEVGEIVRRHTTIDALSYDIIKYMIEKVGAIQGAFYAIEKEDEKSTEFIVMKSCYAYNRKKYIQTKFKFGEGLVGQVAIEGEMMFRIEIPEEYCSITSGLLKDQKPNAILIAPLIKDEKVFGVIEFASLNVFKEDEIQFVKEVGPIIARTIFNIHVNEHTQRHLEQSQRMSAELQQQQEELRQNAEEMRSSQEDLQRANEQLEEQIEEVNRTQQRMQSLLENASEVITIYEKDGRIRYISPSVHKILGIPTEELTGNRDHMHVHPEDIEDFKEMFRKLLVSPELSLPIQYRYKSKDGGWIWLEATGKNLLADPAVNGIIVNSRDITLKRKAEVEERMRKNMQALSENSPDLITRLSADGAIAYTNPIIENYTGLSTSVFMNQNLETISVDNQIIESWKNILSEVIKNKTKLHKELHYSSSTLGDRIMQVNAIPEYNENDIESVLVVSHDITEMKKIERDVQAKNKNIEESITYSKRIQNAIIPDTNTIRKCFKDSFLLYKPRDTVSGDFPWFMQKGDDIFIAVVDCTGHGVPGAMLSLVGYFQLNNIVDAHPEYCPAHILDEFDRKVNEALIKDTNEENIKDGMDIALCKINLTTKTVEYAGAHRPLYQLQRDGNLEEYKGDKWAIGGGTYRNQTKFTNYKIVMKNGESIFFFSDGFPDQFGGPNNRKFGTARIKDIILKNKKESMDQVHKSFLCEFDDWKSHEKQTDDVLLIGIKF